MRTVSFNLRYDASKLAPRAQEFSPILAVWSSFKHTKDFAVYPLTHTDRGSLSEQVAVEIELPPAGARAADDAVWFEAYAMTPNKSGEHVRTRVGSGFVFTADLIQHERTDDDLVLDLAYFNYWDRSGERVVKGQLRLQGTEISEDYAAEKPSSSPFDYVPAQNAFLQAEMQEAIRLSIWPYTDMAEKSGEAISPLNKKNSRVHAPAWNSPTGFKPGFSYFITPGRRAPPVSERTEDTMLAPLRAVLARHNRTEKWFGVRVARQLARTDDTYDDDFTECCDIVGEALCAPSVSMPYIGDSINTAARIRTDHRGMVMFSDDTVHGVESFDWASLRGGGDCEDFARLIHQQRCSLQDGEWSNPLLVAAQGVLNCYIGLGVLSSVLGAAIGDEKHHNEPYVVGTARDDNVQIGAHMYYQLMPEHKFLASLKRVHVDLDLEALRGPRAPRAEWREKMPHLVLEGTGMLSTLQRPLISYVTDSDVSAKYAIIQREKDRAALLAHLAKHAIADFNGRVVSIMALAQTIRHQKLLTRTPNARVGGFYRDATHAYCDDFIRRGFSVGEFTWVSVGEPSLVPSSADPMYADDPMLGSAADKLSESGDEQYAPAASSLGSWEDLKFDSSAAEDTDSHSDCEGCPDCDNAPAAPAPAVPSIAESDNWRKPLLSAEELINGPIAGPSHHTGSRRFDTFDYAAASVDEPEEPAEIRYGLPLTTTLEDRPMRSHVGLMAGAPLDAVSAGVLATHYRHSKPIPLGGDTSNAEKMHQAQRASLAGNGVDMEALEKTERVQLERFTERFSRHVASKWQQHSKYALVNLFISSKFFRTPGIDMFIVSALETQRKSGVIKYARIQREQFVPGHTNIVVQLLCDASSIRQ